MTLARAPGPAGRWLRLRHWTVAPAGWNARRLRIVMIADIHAGGPQMPLARVRQAVEAANALAPDLVAVMGDYRADHPFQIRTVAAEAVAEALGHLRAPLGAWAILGNHDWHDDRAATARRAGPVRAGHHLAAAGLTVLENEAVRLGAGSDAFWLAGLGSQRAFRRRRGRPLAGTHDLAGTLSRLADDAPAILLAHEPDIFPEVPDRVALTLAGHTHGGQINLWGWTPVVPSRFGSRYVYGHIREGRRDLVVSGGLGCSGLPLRFNRPPELTVVDLS
ncbi:MAG: metallophosphoesterase [Rhodobacteraceae bacterium]|nr:metallophosphoesterase [Paracoccaceae bacterium]